MNTDGNTTKKKKPVLKIILISLVVMVVTAGILLYNNFNRLLSTALLNSFNSTLISDVYELKFENLRVNVFEGSIRVINVSFQPREKPLNNYPYINSSFRLTTEEITLENVEIRTLLKLNHLILDRISIIRPEVDVLLNGDRHILLPFKDTTATVQTNKEHNKKKSLGTFLLNEFQLKEATFHVTNSSKLREFNIRDFSISLHDLLLSQQPGEYMTSFNQVTLGIGDFNGELKKGALQHLGFKDFKIAIDTLALQLTLDTLMYRFHDFYTAIHDLDIQTSDSLFHVTMHAFDLSYEKKSIQLKEVSFQPNVSHAVLQKKHKYQHTEFSGSISRLELNEVNFDSLLYAQKLFIGEIKLEDAKAAIFKDKTKPMDSTRFPVYLGQTIRAIKLPLLIRQIKATNVELKNTEQKPDGTQANVTISKATLGVNNITNLDPKEKLTMQADAYINGKVRFTAALSFSYSKPQFSFEGTLEKFNLPDLNALIQAYTPAKINKGVSDEISFSGIAEQTNASGTMKFLYHDLEVDLELQDQAKWKSSVIAFAANTALNSSNPTSSNVPPREVKFNIERDMNKGFVNVIIKSVLNGLKETMIMSKENRKSHKESKKEARKENKK